MPRHRRPGPPRIARCWCAGAVTATSGAHRAGGAIPSIDARPRAAVRAARGADRRSRAGRRAGARPRHDRYDLEWDVALQFVTPTVVGELRRHFRDHVAVHVPRSVHDLATRIGRASADSRGEPVARRPWRSWPGGSTASEEQVLKVLDRSRAAMLLAARQRRRAGSGHVGAPAAIDPSYDDVADRLLRPGPRLPRRARATAARAALRRRPLAVGDRGAARHVQCAYPPPAARPRAPRGSAARRLTRRGPARSASRRARCGSARSRRGPRARQHGHRRPR